MRDLRPLFAPRSIAVIGISRSGRGWGAEIARRLAHYDYPGKVYAVSNQASDLPLCTVPKLGDIPEPVDTLIVAVPAGAVPEIIEEARSHEACRSALVFSSGFAENGSDGRHLEDRLRKAALTLPVLGPNCLGFVNRTDRVYASMSQYLARPQLPPPGRVGIISQSGALGFVLSQQLERSGLAFSQYVSVGNEACLGTGEIGQYLVTRDDVAVIGLYLEAVRDADSLAELASEAHAREKAVVALKSGATAASQRATLSHTAAVAGDPLLFDAFCRKHGIIQAESDEAFADLLIALQRNVRLPTEPKAAIVTMSGGAGALLADRLSSARVEVPELSAPTQQAVRDLDLFGLAAHGNPIDLGGQSRASYDRFPDLLTILDRDSDVDAVIAYFTFGDDITDTYSSLASGLAGMNKPGWMIWAGQPTEMPQLPPGVVFGTIEQVARVVNGLLTISDFEGLPPGNERPRPASPLAGIKTEVASMPVLVEAGVPYVATAVFDGPTSTGVDGLPAADRYVVKIDSPQELHRARAGLIRLDVPAADVSRVADALWKSAQMLTDRKLIVQPQLASEHELSLGLLRDPAYGLIMIAGPGGSQAEDTTLTRLAVACPSSRTAIKSFCRRVCLLFPGLDADALEEIAQAVQEIGLREELLQSMDVNPLLVGRNGSLTAVDSLIVCAAGELPA